MDNTDYYAVLGVAPDASTDEIKKRYRKLARRYHPDVTKDDDGEARFKEVNEAWRVLKSDEARGEYDAYRRAQKDAAARAQTRPGTRDGASYEGGADPFSGFANEPGASQDAADYSEFFREMFGDRFREAGMHAGSAGERGGARRASGPRQGEDVRASLALPIREAFAGASVPVSLRAPRISESGQLEMADRTLKVTIPAGVTSGRSLRLRGQGGVGIDGGEPGDLYIEIEVIDDDNFALDGRDVVSTVDVAPWELALGATITVATLGGRVSLKVPAESQNGRRLRLRGRGFPGKTPGDHFAVLRMIMPPVDTAERTAAWERLKEAWPDGLAARGGS